jgi:hypothetical protein
MIQVLSGHTSPETAFVCPDYPYGFRLRCQIRFWIETTKHGQRVVSQTTNPKKAGIVWNKPKASTYTNLRALFLDEQGHVVNEALSFYADAAKIAAHEALFGAAWTSERDQRELRLLKAVAARSEQAKAIREAREQAVAQ